MGSELSTVSAETSLAFFQKIKDPIDAIKYLGRSIALSGFLGACDIPKGEVLAMQCLSEGVSPLELKRRYHVTQFGLIQQSSYTMEEFQRIGGKVKQLARTPDLAHAEFSLNSETVVGRLSWDEAKKEPFPYDGKERDIVKALQSGGKPSLKPKYATPNSRMQMLWWRMVNDTIRSNWSRINGGMYSAEEIGGDDDEVIEADFTIVSDTESTAITDSAVADAAAATVVDQTPVASVVVDRCSDMAEQSINEMFATLGVSSEDKLEMVGKKYGVARISKLSKEQSHELIEILRGKVQKLAAAEAEANAELKRQADVAREIERAKHTAPGVAVDNEGPCSEVQIAEAKRLLSELEQSKPGSVAKFVAALKAANLAKIADLSACECDELIRTLGIKNLEAFIESTLRKRYDDIPF